MQKNIVILKTNILQSQNIVLLSSDLFFYRGDVHDTMKDILGGLRSACTYVGAGRVKEMPKRTTFIRVTQQLNEIFS